MKLNNLNNEGIILSAVYLVIVVLVILSLAVMARSVSEGRLVERTRDSSAALAVAEAGLERALYELRQNFGWTTGITNQSLGSGTYSVSVNQIDSSNRSVMATGYIPNSASPRITRTIQANIRRGPGLNTSNAIYCAGELELKGEAYSITGNVTYADELEGDTTPNVSGGTQSPNPNRDPSISPLTALDFQSLRDTAVSQGNLWSASRPQTGFPTEFCYQGSIAGGNCVPNVIYVETDLELNGNIGTIAGFFVVVGDVLTNPTGHYDTEINGNGQIAGAIYTTGEFEINGGGGRLNVNGGVWAGTEAEIKGNSSVVYNSTYMGVIENIVTPEPQITGWREI